MSEHSQFETFMRAYQNMVFTTAARLLASDAEAQDIAQEVFLKAYARFEELSQSQTAGGWLKTVTTNMCLNHLSRYRARWRFFSELISGEGGDDVVLDVPDPETTTGQLDEADHRRLLEEALQKLPAAQRVPLVLFHFESQSYEEIAGRLGASLSKVKTDIFRGREALRRRLQLGPGSGDQWDEFKPRSKRAFAQSQEPRRGDTHHLLAPHFA